MQNNVEDALQAVRAISNAHRLMLLCSLGEEEKSVSALAEELGLRQATMSQHLARLRQEGVVSARRVGQTVYYRIADRRVQRLIDTLYEQFCGLE